MNRALLLVTAAAACMPAFPQTAEPPAVLGITRESVKEGRSAAHEKVETDYAKAFRKANFPYHYIALDSMSGPGEVWFLSGYPSFEAVEKGENEIHKPAMKNEMDMLDSRDGELRSSSRNMYAVYRKDLSFHPDKISLAKCRYWMVQSLRVRLGHTDDFMAGAKAVLAADEKSNSPVSFVTYQVITGTPNGLFLFFAPMESLKVMDQMQEQQKAFAEAMGPENYGKLMKGSGDVFASMESTWFMVNPRMSYMSKQVEDADPVFWRPKMPAAKPAAEKPKDTKEKAGQ